MFLVTDSISFLDSFLIFKKIYLFIYLFICLFIDRREGREKEKETSMCGHLLCTLNQGTWPSNQAHALDWESNQQPFTLHASVQTIEPHQPEP